MLSMKRLFLSLFILSFIFGTPSSVFADTSGLITCRDSSTFQCRLDSSVAKLTARLTNYEEGTPAYLALQDQIDRIKRPLLKKRFTVWCGRFTWLNCGWTSKSSRKMYPYFEFRWTSSYSSYFVARVSNTT